MNNQRVASDLLKLAKELSEGHSRVANINVLDKLVSERDLSSLRNVSDEQTFELSVKVYMQLKERLSLSSRESEALNRLIFSVGSKNPGMIRNNIFKAANALGMKLPSSSF